MANCNVHPTWHPHNMLSMDQFTRISCSTEQSAGILTLHSPSGEAKIARKMIYSINGVKKDHRLD